MSETKQRHHVVVRITHWVNVVALTIMPRRGLARDGWQMVKFYLALRREHPRQGKHNALQTCLQIYFD